MTEIRSWLDTTAGHFAATDGQPMPRPEDFERAEQAEVRAQAFAAYQAAHRPHERPALPVTSEQRMIHYARQAAMIKIGANWVGDGTPAGDAEIRERIRRMTAFQLSDEAAASAEITGPSDGPSTYQLAAHDRMLKGVPNG